MAASQPVPGTCGMIYDVTVAGLRHYADADIKRMMPASVTRHVDGDTIWVHIPCPPPGPAAEEKVRLLGLDTPEVGAPGATEAAEFVRRRIGGDPVYLAFDFRRRDRFDRLLAYVYLADGTLLNARLIECGHAQPYRRERNHFSDLFEQLAAAPPLDGCALAGAESTTPNQDTTVTIVTIENNSYEEHIVLRNESSDMIDVSGWRINDCDEENLVLPDVDPLEPGGTLALCSGRDGCVGNPRPSLTLNEKNVWDNDGDAAVLCDARGNEVDRYCYSEGCSEAKPAPRCA